MPNIMLTTVCNLNCDYCFARETFSSKEPFITIDSFEKIAKFLSDNGEHHIGLIGGEPLMHPEFDKIVRIALSYVDAGDIILFTNGLFIDRVIDTLKDSMIRIMINCNGEGILGNLKQHFLDNISLCAESLNWDKMISLSYNLYTPNQNYREFLDLIDKYPVKSIRMAIASPSIQKRVMMPTDYFNEMKETAIKFFSEINKRGIRITMDCNVIPNCMQDEILQRVTHPFVGHFPKSVCWPVLDFCIDESVIRCFGLSDLRVDMNQL